MSNVKPLRPSALAMALAGAVAQPVEKTPTSILVSHQDGKVRLQYPEPVLWSSMEPATAIQLGEALIQHARECTAPAAVEEPKT